MANYVDELNQYLDNNQTFMKEVPGPGKGFDILHWTASQPGALTPAEKELIALSMAVNMRCESCMVQHTASALIAGATRDQIKEALGVTLEMSGGPTFVYGPMVLDMCDQLLADPDFKSKLDHTELSSK